MTSLHTIGGFEMSPDTRPEILATIESSRTKAIRATSGIETASATLAESLGAFWQYCDSIAVADGDTLDQPQAWWAWTHETLDGCPSPTIPNPESDEPMPNPEWSTLKTTANNAARAGALAVEMDSPLPIGAFSPTDRTYARPARFAQAIRQAVKASDARGAPVEMIEVPDIIGGRDTFRQTPDVPGLADIVGTIDAPMGDSFRKTMKLAPRDNAPMTGPAALKSLRRPFDSGVDIARIVGPYGRRLENMTPDEVDAQWAFVEWLRLVGSEMVSELERVAIDPAPVDDSGDDS